MATTTRTRATAHVLDTPAGLAYVLPPVGQADSVAWATFGTALQYILEDDGDYWYNPCHIQVQRIVQQANGACRFTVQFLQAGANLVEMYLEEDDQAGALLTWG